MSKPWPWSEPAFPCHSVDGAEEYQGMNLRDYFAAQALAGWNEGYHSIAWKVGEETPGPTAIAVTAYQIADAMLKAREGA